MKRVWIVLVMTGLLGASPVLVAQMRGSGGMGQSGSSGGGMQGPSGQQGMGSGQGMGGSMGRSGGMLTGEQRRAVMHTTQAQNTQYAACAQAMDKVRSGISHMAGMKSAQGSDSRQSGQSADNQPSTDGSDQLSSDLQDLEQDQNDFLDSLNKDQKAALEGQIKDVQKKLKQLDEISKELRADMEAKSVDQARIRSEVKKLDKLSKAIQNEQRQIAGALGIQS